MLKPRATAALPRVREPRAEQTWAAKTHTFSVPSEQPLVAGQKVELGIAEGSLLTSAMLVYLPRWWVCS
jgi:positive regulator of sigma E activity